MVTSMAKAMVMAKAKRLSSNEPTLNAQCQHAKQNQGAAIGCPFSMYESLVYLPMMTLPYPVG